MITAGSINTTQGCLRQQRGFTLLEVLVVLAIVSILTMIAVPLYQDYRTRVKITAEFPLMDPLMRQVTEEFMMTGAWPATNADAAASEASAYHGDYLQSIEVSEVPKPGSLILTYDSTKLTALGENNTIIFYPVEGGNGRNLIWACDQGTIVAKYRTDRCR